MKAGCRVKWKTLHMVVWGVRRAQEGGTRSMGRLAEPVVPLQDGICVLLLLTFLCDKVLGWKGNADCGFWVMMQGKSMLVVLGSWNVLCSQQDSLALPNIMRQNSRSSLPGRGCSASVFHICRLGAPRLTVAMHCVSSISSAFHSSGANWAWREESALF